MDAMQTDGSFVPPPIAATNAEIAGLRHLIRVKLTVILPILIVSAGSFLLLSIVAGFAGEVLTRRVVGALNLGFLFIFCDYLLILASVVVYARIARGILDPIADRVAREAEARQ